MPKGSPKDNTDAAPTVEAATRARDLLDHLTRDELITLADRCDLRVADRRVKAQLADAAARLSSTSLEAYLGDLRRDRLKELCRALGADQRGADKASLIARLMR